MPIQVMRANPDSRLCRGSCRRLALLAAGLRHPLAPFRNARHCARRPRGSHFARPLEGCARRHPRLDRDGGRDSLERH